MRRGIDVETLYRTELKWTAVAIRYYVQALNKEARWQSCGRNKGISSNRSWKTSWKAATGGLPLSEGVEANEEYLSLIHIFCGGVYCCDLRYRAAGS